VSLLRFLTSVAPQLLGGKSSNPAAPLTTAAFAVCVLLGGGMVISCERRATQAGQCDSTYLTAAGIIGAGGLVKTSNEAGFQTINPAFDSIRRAQLREEGEPIPASGGEPPEPTPEPDWLRDVGGLRDSPPPSGELELAAAEALLAAVEPAVTGNSTAERMARAAAKLARQRAS